MKRDERKLYRALGEAAIQVAESRGYAEEYVAKNKLVLADKALCEWARGGSTSREKDKAL